MQTFLLLWNKSYWSWDTLEADISGLSVGKHIIEEWGCGSSAKVGDRIFLKRIGDELAGIMASGFVITDAYKGQHYSQDKQVWKAKILLDELYLQPLITSTELKSLELTNKALSPQATNRRLSTAQADLIEQVWHTKTIEFKSKKIIDGSK